MMMQQNDEVMKNDSETEETIAVEKHAFEMIILQMTEENGKKNC